MSRIGEKMEISLKAYGKINLGLDVVRRREDGYHEVKMIMQTVDLWDELTFCDVTTDEIVITSDSAELPDVKDNIIYKACRMMKDIYGIDKGVHVTVDKHIPVAAGMAGGSADAAADIKAMNMMIGLTLTDEQLMEVAKTACSENDTLHNMPFEVTPETVFAAMKAADAYGRYYLGEN